MRPSLEFFACCLTYNSLKIKVDTAAKPYISINDLSWSKLRDAQGDTQVDRGGIQSVNPDMAIFNPASVFKTPAEILANTEISLTKEQKIQALLTWQYDIQLRRVAEEENMHSNQEIDSDLEGNIILALRELQGE